VASWASCTYGSLHDLVDVRRVRRAGRATRGDARAGGRCDVRAGLEAPQNRGLSRRMSTVGGGVAHLVVVVRKGWESSVWRALD
jgi:hypothetical protein